MSRIELKPLPPEEAIKAFEARQLLKPGFAWQDIWKDEHARAFTVAKMMRLDLLQTVYDAVDQAIKDGTTVPEFQNRLRPILEREGWWGQQEMPDPLTGEKKLVQLGSLRRLEVIFDTNLRTSYAAGHWAQIQRTAARRPYLRYSAVLDSRTRPQHRAWHGTTLRADDDWWDTHYPPNGWRCRCTVIQMGERDLERYGGRVTPRPPTTYRDWTNPRTGEVMRVPQGIDPGWDYNVGKAAQRAQRLQGAMRQKLDAVPSGLARAAVRDLVKRDLPAWWAHPQGDFPVAVMPKTHAESLGAADTQTVLLSPATREKQADKHPELTPAEYARIQEVIDAGHFVQDGPRSGCYILEQVGGYVLVIKATKTGRAIFAQSYRRLSSQEAKRDAEIQRLLRKAEEYSKKG